MRQLLGAVAPSWGLGGWEAGRLTSDPADRLIVPFQQPPLSLLFTSLNEHGAGVRKRAGGNNEARPGGRLVGEGGGQRKGR